MKIRVYHITVMHGDKDKPCTCDDDQLDRIEDSLPDDDLVIEFILANAFRPGDAPVTAEAE